MHSIPIRTTMTALIKSAVLLTSETALTGANARTDLSELRGNALLFCLARANTFLRLRCQFIRLSVVYRTNAIGEIHQKQIWVIDLHLRWDAAHPPVLDPLGAPFLVVQTIGELRRAAKAVDDFAIGVRTMFAHGVY